MLLSMTIQNKFPFSDELNAVVGTNLTLVCNSLTDKVWWSKDGKNITINNKK